MTFIATVIAKNGAAVIADSLVTTSHPMLEYEDFLNYLKRKSGKSKKKSIDVIPEEIIDLFETKPHHTKDYEEKLFKYDDFTSITTAGSANLNDRSIKDVLEEIVDKNSKTKGYKNKKILTKVKDLVSDLNRQVNEHLKKHSSVRETTFIVTNYNKKNNETKVFKVKIQSASSKKLDQEDFEFVKYKEADRIEKVICDGQNRISERILFGDLPLIWGLVPKIVEQVAKDFGIDKSEIGEEYFSGIRNNQDIVSKDVLHDMKILKLNGLSLQQATELAALLMRLEMDFQSYTEDIPTVGGVIKLAVIDKNGFKYIAGDRITRPSNI
ncbi:hypothetical protein SAMN04487891_108169 [Flagellimonas taeanensis]|uniref:Uncharacterized protein n=1 Tax=Flagellimonas taeanensis TaxID=1005926 RepID=A0A1M6ZQB0_9FLAO|nr:hypothetical protein [Allomuricauda taeanensis]SFC29669.1 hypothetical protein SAMN04487891_108169 [Allomuricauda taeanensis]SHL32523.1 hypothetical protein SAMN05216293_3198 [Allomuricauda taeanensis]